MIRVTSKEKKNESNYYQTKIIFIFFSRL